MEQDIINDLIAKLLTEGSAEFSQDGLNIKATYDNGCLKLGAKFESPKVDLRKELVENFQNYINSLNDDFFLEVAESFKDGELKKIQDKLDSKFPAVIQEGIDDFEKQLKTVAAQKVRSLSDDIEKAEKELSELIEIRDSYIHVINKKL